MEQWFTPEKITVMALLLGIIGAGYKRLWVWGYQLAEAETRAEKWETIAMKALTVTEKVVSKSPDVQV